MTASPKTIESLARRPFADTPPTAAEHFRLALFGVIARLTDACGDGDRKAAFVAYPFLGDYAHEMARRIKRSDCSAAYWCHALEAWERRAPQDLPLRALVAAGLGRLELNLVLTVGLAEEDPRFLDLFEQMTGRERRPTPPLLIALWRTDAASQDCADVVRRATLDLVRSGLLQVLNPNAARSEWALSVAPSLWDALRGEPPQLAWLAHHARGELLAIERYLTAPAVLRMGTQLSQLIAEHPEQIVVVRGARQNGRKTLVGALAHALQRGILVANESVLADDQRWRLFGVLAVTLCALPVIEIALAPGENRRVPALPLVAGPIAVVAGPHGGIEPEDGRSLLNVMLPLPDADCRRRHWQDALPGQPATVLDALAQTFRLSSGNIRRAARTAHGHARLEGRDTIEARDVQVACRGLHGARLEALATRLEAGARLGDVALDDATRTEMEALRIRCVSREALAATSGGGAQQGSGVRALLAGPSGTGKTLAARVLAASLDKDLYRVDLAATVNKYLGETEKNLDHVFSAAEELDVVLLLDEGDALMAGRTDVSSANDRYANLETNFLLQRIEAYDGILVVTTNAVDRIDKAFARRMDAMITFRPPDELRRYEILCMHLGAHAADDDFLQEIACRCSLTGGQLRNIALHARLLALDAERALGEPHLRAAVMREYRKTGAHCPLKPAGPTARGGQREPHAGNLGRTQVG